jgi:hypothetical protein
MTSPENEPRRLGLLCLLADPKPMHPLMEVLRGEGMQVDSVADLQAARTSFFGSGGHDCLIFAPDVKPGLAARVALSLAQVDPNLAMATFGPSLANRSVMRTAKLGSFHPGSRAGQGALLRFLRSL